MSATVFDRGVSQTASFLPQVVVATGLVAVMPIAVVWELCEQGVLSSLWSCLLAAVGLALGASAAGSAYWKRRRRAADLMFSELLVWNWLRRLRTERRLADTSEQLIDAGLQPRDPALLGEQGVRMLRQLVLSFEALDAYTAGHSRRVARHAMAMAARLNLSAGEIERIRLAATVHDVGKLRVPQGILDKPSPLTAEEYELVKRHAAEGAAMVNVLGDDELTSIVRHHHEWIDGSGYPDSLSADAIPVGARIIAVADTYDAIIMPRPYRGPAPHKRAIDVLEDEAGTHFDPEVVEAFVASYSSRRLLLFWSAFAIAVKRLFAWPRSAVGLPRGRPSTLGGHAMTSFALGSLAVAAAGAALTHTQQHRVHADQPAPAVVAQKPPAAVPSVTVRASSHQHAKRARTHRRPHVRHTARHVPAVVAAPAQIPAPALRITAAAPAPRPSTPAPMVSAPKRPVAKSVPPRAKAARPRPAPHPQPRPPRPTAKTHPVAAPPVAASISSLVGCGSVPAGGGTCAVQWVVANADSCVLTVSPDPGTLSGPVDCAAGSSVLTFPANGGSAPQSWTVTLTGSGAAGTAPVAEQVTVTEAAAPPVAAPPVAASISSFVGCGSVPAGGGTCAVQWVVANADSCVLTVSPDPGTLSGPVDCAAGSSVLTFPANGGSAPQSWTVTLTGSGAAGTAPVAEQVTVTEAAAPPVAASISSLVGCGSVPAGGGTCAVQWVVANADSCVLTVSPDPGTLSGPVDCAAGSSVLTFPANGGSAPQSWTVTLTGSGAAGTAPVAEQVTVTEAAAPPVAASISSLVGCGSVPAGGGTCAVQWVVANADSCVLTVSPDPGTLSGPVDCAAGSALLTFPPSRGPAPPSWTVTLTASGAAGTAPASDSITVTGSVGPGK